MSVISDLLGMPKSVPLPMPESDCLLLTKMLRSGKTERRMYERARVVLIAAERRSGIRIASMFKTRPARVSKWTSRYRRHGLAGIYDLPRNAEKRRKYSSNTEQRILAALARVPQFGRVLSEIECAWRSVFLM